ncbi:MAG: DNA-binding protein [Chitinophagaceae bacterium]|nr:DNA-binding protein [Chitinophagaceae bacterium]
MNDLTISTIDRQNVLNNRLAVEQIQKYLGLSGMLFNGEYKFTIQQVMNFYLVDRATINRYLGQYENELKHNGYEVLKGKKLKEFKLEFGHILEEGTKAPLLGVFSFRTVLNLGMLLSESEKAKALRSKMLDIVIDTINNKLGGSTKYINQRDEDFFTAILKEPHYRKKFTSALNKYVEMDNSKYAFFTDKIYKSIFNENAKEYKHILQLEDTENPRDTMYGEVLKIIASFENGIAHEMEKKSQSLSRKMTTEEMEELVDVYAKHPLYKPLIEDACTKMASRDYGFRQVFHDKLRHYLSNVPLSDFDRFLGEKSKSFEERLEENKDVFIRLKDR